MNRPHPSTRISFLVAAIVAIAAVPSQAGHAPRAVLPDAIVDLRTTEGVARANAQWRYSDTRINEIDHRNVGPDLKASGPKNRTFDFTPDARAKDFDDSTWEIIPADSLEQRRGHGRLSLNWYRLNVRIPEKVGSFETRGSSAVFEIVVDDYAEVWVNGQAPFVLGQNGGAVAAGWSAPNRIVLTRDAVPGESFKIAVLGINGPLSTHPDTFIWIRSATLDFYAPHKLSAPRRKYSDVPGGPFWRRLRCSSVTDRCGYAPSSRLACTENSSPLTSPYLRLGALSKAREVKLEVDRKDSALDTIFSPGAKLEKLADGFTFTEGPVWVPEGEGYLLFSDPNNNVIYRMTFDGEVSLYLTKSGYTGENIGEYRQPGSNGLALDKQGRLTICQHGNRRVVRIEKNGLTTVLADRFEGRRLNSPNDLVYRGDGTLFFTDPPFGLPKFATDTRRETSHSGVYSVKDGLVRLLSTDFTGPNGLAFSPDERFLYVGNWDDKNKVVYRYPVNIDGTVGKGELFHDLTPAQGEDAIDGVKVDQRGHVYVSGPGGLWIFDPTGKHLGTLRFPEHPHNMAWGDNDGRTLYLAAQTGIYRLRLNVAGAGPWPKPLAMAEK